jgi:hypothetical protein
MLTILAWMAFIPAVIWNMAMLIIAFTDIVGDITGDRKLHWANWRNIRDLVLSLAVLFIPGVYLFGWF